MGVKTMKDKLVHKYGLHVHKRKLYKAKTRALLRSTEDFTQFYAKLPSYAKILIERDQGAIVKSQTYHVGNKIRFKRFFVSFLGLTYEFVNRCRRFIEIDECHLKGPHEGVLLFV